MILWDMVNDLHQARNVAETHPDVVKELDHVLMEWTHQNLLYHGAKPDPLQEAVESGPWRYTDPHYWLRRLEQKGRTDAVADILERLDVERDLTTPRGLKPRR